MYKRQESSKWHFSFAGYVNPGKKDLLGKHEACLLYTSKRESFFVPKINGIGFSVNPNTFEGKIIWYVVFLVVIIFLLVTIFT